MQCDVTVSMGLVISFSKGLCFSSVLCIAQMISPQLDISLIMSGTLQRWQCILCFEIDFFLKMDVDIEIIDTSLNFGAGKQNKSLTSPENRKKDG